MSSSKINNALELIGTFANGDTVKASSLLADGYIQHNLSYETGKEAFIGSVTYLASAPVKTTVKNIRAFEDGDKVFLHTIYNFAGAGEQVGFDVFLFNESGKIIEHWDNLADVTKANPSGRTQTDGVIKPTTSEKEETRRIVTNFVYDVLHGKKPENLTSYFDGDKYIQHNSAIADGLSGLGEAMTALAEANLEMIYNETHQVLASDDFALAISEGNYCGDHVAYYDLFRVENGKIAEHWDIIEKIPTEVSNENGKF